MLHLFILIFFTVTTSFINTMELLPKKDDKDKHGWSLFPTHKPKKSTSDETIRSKKEDYQSKRSQRSRRSLSLSSIEHDKISIQTSNSGNDFITAVRNNHLEQINFYLEDAWFNPNIADQWGNTAAHFVITFKYLQLTQRFIKDCRFDFSIKNKHGVLPLHLVEETDHEQRQQVFARCTLDIFINSEAKNMLSTYLLGQYNSKTFDTKAEEIRTKINNNKITQDEPLPKDAELQDYATIQFIQNMLRFRMSLIRT